MSIGRMGVSRRVGRWCLWFGLVACSLAGVVDDALAQDGAGAIEPTQIDLDQLVADGRIGQAMCEPSAALIAPWDQDVVLVADNEVRQQIYVFGIGDPGLQFVEALDVPGRGGKRPRDIEALAALGNSVLIVGSHSRNTSCEERDDRRRMEWVRRTSEGDLEADDFINSRPELKEALESEDDCIERLFVEPAPPHANDVCRALVAAEQAADDGAPPCACTALNIEGAVGLPEGRIWLGLRAPLADRKAIMLRLAPDHDEPHFDRVVLVDLGNRGIRELAYDQSRHRVWGLAGPDVDRPDPFRLWHVSLDDLAGGGDLVGVKDDRELPTSSEGLVMLEDRALLLVDGDQGEDSDGGTCAVHGSYYELALTP